MEIKKKSENVYEIPIEREMNVPGIVYASEKLLKKMKEDRTLTQVRNVACMPGIINASIALSDAHEGYGFSIGGVAAFDIDKGVISPGGVGYDIGCLHEDSKVLGELGYWKKIKDFEKNQNKLIIFDKEMIKSKNSEIQLFMKKYFEKIIKIKTESGNEIFATVDHPIYTKEGMKESEKLCEGEEILCYPFEGVEYEIPENKLLLSEKEIDILDRSFTSKLQIKNKLKELGLLPLYSDNPKLPYLIKMMGFIFGDGSLSIGKNDQIGFYGNEEDLILIKEDLNKIGFNSSIFSRKRKHNITTQYKQYNFERIEYSLKSNSSALALLLNLLGVPKGNKSKQDYNIPQWIMNSVRWHQRLFLASLFGAELSSPKTATNQKFNFYGLVYSINKENSLHGINFVNQISKLLNDFEVENVLIKNREDEVNGKKSTRIRLMIYSDTGNLIKFFSKINYEYNIKKRKLANAAILWLKQKEKIVKFREEVMLRAREMKLEGLSKSRIIENLEGKYANKYFIDKSIYYSDYGKSGSRIAYCFISFNEFVEMNCYGEEGFVWDKIESKELLDHNNAVYDLTIDDENHNFIANGIVVSNCSVRLLKTNLTKKDLEGKKKEVLDELFKMVPSGVGRGGPFNISRKKFSEILNGGAQWMVENGYGEKEDYLHSEEEGKMKDANPDKVTDRAISRGIGQLGTIGAGNHFLEIQYVDEIFDNKVAKVLNLEKNQVCIMIHCGSRGLGHQIASDYIKLMEDEYGKYGKELKDRELINAPIKSKLGKDYYEAMCCGINFAFANKQLITHNIRIGMKKIFPKLKIDVVYDVCHNIAKFEEHLVEGKKKMVCVHRKGATRSFGAGRSEIPKTYRKIGQPVLIPGSMGTASYILLGNKKAEELTFGSTVHGAGRLESRGSAKRRLHSVDIRDELTKKGISLKSGSEKGIVEEAPEVYKDIEEVVNVVHDLGLSTKVARLKPMAVIKG
ncbi:RNA-splicing ligase RtcB [Candidatus Pacearchaeota archaeon CG10_big_fil_rev_8_21_14_0_10_32_14]|nr:MAG: RNA-splicing ligase RtcB [Candidatus Pacearchaeota archaeon CG10_big_fil_rev_8_21_14_0_10_32_14]